MNLEKLRADWKERVNNFKSSGLSMNKWCEEQGLKVHQLQYWKDKFNDVIECEQIKPTNWVSLDLSEKTQFIKSDNNSEIRDIEKSVKQKGSDENGNTISISIGKCSIKLQSGFKIKVLNSVC